jgi:hypothetical protein
MRVLDLSGHYRRRVEIDTCPHCCLVWFDDTESVRLAGPGIADFVREIHGAMQAGGEHAHAVSLARVQSCPVCGAALKSSANLTRFGRTTHLECPQGHGYYQTYILYLAEKGFVRPLAWADIRSLQETGKELFCASCGYPLPARPAEECPACHSAIGIIDPARLASAIDPHDIAGTIASAAEAKAEAVSSHPAPANTARSAAQHKCHACGGAIDLTRHIHCPHCHAPVLRRDTANAASAAEAARAALTAARANPERQHPAVSRAKLAEPQYPMADLTNERRTRRLQSFEIRLAIGLVIGALTLGIMAWYRQPAQRSEWTPQQAPLLAYSERFKDPFMACDKHALSRSEVRVRQLVVAPGEPGPGPAHATYGALRAAQVRAIALRHEWMASGAFEELQGHFDSPYATARSMPPGFFRRGEALPAVERAAFCLAVDEISPPLLAEDGFHIVQVVEAR